MANKEVNIYFKVDGLDEYITDLGDLKNALQGVEAATDDVNVSTESLEDAADRLDAVEGSVKVLAGSVEFLAGAFALAGDENNEFIKAVEDNVVGILALGQGVIDVTEGYRLLKNNTALASAAQRVFNAVSNANPYVILAGVILSLAGAYAGLSLATSENTDETEENTDEIIKNREERQKLLMTLREESDLRLERARISNINDANAVKAEIDRIKASTAAKQAEIQALDERLKYIRDTFTVQENIDQRTEVISEAIAKLNEEIDSENDLLALLIERYNDLNTESVKQVERINTEIESINILTESWRQYYRLRDGGDRELAKSTTRNIGSTSQQIDSFADQYFKAFSMVVEEPKAAADLLRRDLTATFEFAGNLATLFSKDNEERAERNFRISKGLALSTAVINTAEGITTALTDKTQPSTILRILQTAAVAAAGAAQIATIARQEFNPEGAGGVQSINQPRAISPSSSINYNFGQTAGEEITINQQGGGGQQPQPIQAYVLASDVNNAQQTQQAIDNLSRL